MVTADEPDHPFAKASQRTHTWGIECARCAETHALIEQNSMVVLVERGPLAVRIEIAGECEHRSRILRESTVVHEAKLVLAKKLDTQFSTKASVYRYLGSLDLIGHESQQSFTRHWRGGESWVRFGAYTPKQVLSVLRAVGRLDSGTEQEIAELVDLGKRASAPLPVVRAVLRLVA